MLSVTLLMFHRSTPVPVKEDAPLKVPNMSVTEDVIHALTSLLNAAAPLKVYFKLVAEDVSHLLRSPLNVMALVLPVNSYSPASLREVVKAAAKEGTPLVSQSSMGPHLVAYVDGELTTAHVAS